MKPNTKTIIVSVWSGRGQAPAWIELGNEVNETGKKLPLREFSSAEQTK